MDAAAPAEASTRLMPRQVVSMPVRQLPPLTAMVQSKSKHDLVDKTPYLFVPWVFSCSMAG
jgi:hypothetical protein